MYPTLYFFHIFKDCIISNLRQPDAGTWGNKQETETIKSGLRLTWCILQYYKKMWCNYIHYVCNVSTTQSFSRVFFCEINSKWTCTCLSSFREKPGLLPLSWSTQNDRHHWHTASQHLHKTVFLQGGRYDSTPGEGRLYSPGNLYMVWPQIL